MSQGAFRLSPVSHNPESGTISYSYDADGNLLQKTSPAPNQTGTATQTISYCYDQLHRVTGKAYSAQSCPLASPVVTYTYDSGANAKGKLTGVTDQAGTASYSYDVLGRLSSETRVIAGISKSISYDYNLDGSLKTLHYPSGAAITYAPDSAGRILSAVDSGNNINYVTSATYQADGQMTGFVSGNGGAFAGVTSAFTYNKRLQPVNMSANAPGQTVFSIGYDFHVGNGVSGADNGNVWNIYNYRDRTRDQSFSYDALNRLTSAQNAGTDCNAVVLQGKKKFWGNTYSYDAWGNLTNKTKISTACAGELLSAPALTNNQLSGYGYDAAGNMTSDPTDNVTARYDAENRIASASTASGAFTYTYDADGNRVEKSGGGSGTLYWYMTPGIVAESDLAGNLKSEYLFFNGERAARRDFDPTTHAPTGVSYYFSDHLKTASVVTDSAGNIKSESDYYPWGGELQFVNNDSNHYKFTGKERDTESGLDYFGARYYSNGLGRFITPDWAAKAVDVPYAEFSDPQSLNLYSYVRNVPTSRADADGHDWPSLGDIAQFAAGVANAYGSDNLLGAGRVDGGSTAYQMGQVVGDGAALISGLNELGTGIAGEGAGLTLDATGVGAIGGVALNVASAGAIVHGSITSTVAGQNLGKAVVNALSGPPNPHGSSGAPDHQAKVNELVDKAKSEAGQGETVESNKQVKGVDSTRRPDAQIVDAQGKTRKVFEAERRPNSTRNKKREAEYKKLKLDNETHSLK